MKPATLICCLIIAAVFAGPASAADAPYTLQTRYARIAIDPRGFITSIISLKTTKDYTPARHPSPLLSLHESGRPYDQLLFPESATVDPQEQQIVLNYPNGAIALVKLIAKDEYFRFQLVSLAPRGDVDNIVWGPLHTTISQTIGDIIGVVRDGHWAIGMLGLDDNTIAGPPVDGDCYQMGYYIHSPDPAKYPVPAKYHEGERFSVGGDGVSDVAFYSRPEEYFQQVLGTAATLQPQFGSTIACHARDRRRSYTYLWSLLPGFERSRPRHQVSDPVDADFIGSSVALYACPDDQGLWVIEHIILAEGLPHITMDGKWIRDPASFRPDIFWTGPHDKLIEYADALDLKAVQDDGQGQYFASRSDHWAGPRVAFSGNRRLSYRQFTDQAGAHGIRYGLHTLCLFLQGGISSDVTPVPSPHLQTVCRTKLARDISPTDTDITVTDPSFLAEKGTWPQGDDSNYLRIGGEMLRYTGITATRPYTLTGVKRGHASKATAHKAGDEVVKLQQNCYNGFCPDMQLMRDYADWYARTLHENGMEYIDFDGLESTLYMNQGYYGTRVFFRRLFDTYGRISGGKSLRVMGSCVFSGAWMYMSVCNVGGGNHMFDPVLNRWGIEGKDIRNGLSASYFPATFGIQDYHSDWSVYDAENLQAKSIGWNATYMLGLNENAVERSGEKAAIFKAFRTWEDARAAGLFTSAIKSQLRDLNSKFHLQQTAPGAFVLYPVREIRIADRAGSSAARVDISNPNASQPLQFSLRINAGAGPCTISLPDGSRITSDRKLEPAQFILCSGDRAFLADRFRKRITELPMDHPAVLPAGKSTISVQFPGAAPAAIVPFELTIWSLADGEPIGK